MKNERSSAYVAFQDRDTVRAMKAAWVNDVHCEFLDDAALAAFLDKLRATDADCVLVGGDVGQAHSVGGYLERLAAALARPIYFVLGNHDFYHGAIADVHASVDRLAAASEHLCWLDASGVVELTPTTCLVGHGGWGDGRYGDFWGSRVALNDFLLIRELANLPKAALLPRLERLGDEAGRHFRSVLPEALAAYGHVVVLTHVPPFVEAAWHEGRTSGEDWLPFFACKASGDALREAMRAHPDRRMTVLCGHTHGGGTAAIADNLTCHTGAARYGRPVVRRVFDWE